jgi:folate-binding protein YgfZ
MRGYEELRSASAWVDLSGRGRIAAAGEDRARLLHAMTTNHIQELVPGQGRYAFFLSAQGKIQADGILLCRAEDFLLMTEPETRTKLFEHLDRFIIADDVTLDDQTGATVEIALEGPQAAGTLRSLGAPVPGNDFDHAEWGPRLVVRFDDERYRIITGVADRADLTARLGAEAGQEAWNITRLERGIPRYGDDITDRHLVQETRQLHAVSFAKGCYLGQEIVERVRSRGQVHKGLAPLEIETGEALPPGTEILNAAGAKTGELMSNVYSPGLGRVVGLAYFRMDQVTGASVALTAGGHPAKLR